MAVPLTEIQLESVADKLREVGRYFEDICRKRRPECSEDNFRAKFEQALYEEALRRLGVPEPVHEYKVSVPEGTLLVRHYRIDSYYGLVFFEYKLPRGEVGKEALGQVRDKYIPGLLNDGNTKALLQRIREMGLKPVIVGIITNGLEVIFVEYDVDDDELSTRRLKLDKEAVRYMIRYIVASWKRRLDAHALSVEFGHGSGLAKRAVRLFYNKLLNAGGRPRDMYEEWKRQVSIVYPGGGAEVAEVAKDYGVEGEADGAALFFAIQTYYALILKLLAAEIASRYYDSVVMSFLKELREAAADEKKMRERLARLEEGGPMAWYGVLNLFEGQLFSWYLDVWDGEVFAVVKEVVNRLSEFDVESLRPETARDLFKVLYEELVPRREVRRKLGIYTTPDWLAELILDELGLTVEKMLEVGKDDPLAPLRVKILDPGAGTGTFLVLYLQRVGEYLRRRFGDQLPADKAAEALRLVTQNVVGFDVDVLALLTARANYLIGLAAAGLLQHKGGKPIEIPIYMANSIAPAEGLKRKILVRGGEVEVITVPTAVDNFDIPLSAMSRVKEVLEVVTDSLRKDEPTERVLRKIGAKGADAEVFKIFYEKLKKLKAEGRDSVWVDVVKSYLIPNAYFGQFDYVVGNPPWITLNKLSASYQELVKPLVKDEYRLTTKSELITQIEMAALFLVRALDLYLKDGGRLGFVMPRSVFSADQHHNFRRGEVAVKYAVEKVVDAEGVSPLFYVPACAVVVRKGGKAQYPIPATVLRGKLPEDRHKTMPLREALKHLSREDRQIYLGEIGGRSAWTYEQLQVAKGRSYYYDYFRQGATIVPRPFFFVEIEDVGEDFVVVRPSKRTERREAKVKFDIPLMPVEKKFLYGILTASEVVPFCHLPPAVVALPIEPRGSSYVLLAAKELRERGYSYMADKMERLEKLWEEYRGEKKEKASIYEWLNYQNKLTAHNPAVKFRVVYNTSGTHLVAAVVEAGKRLVNNIELQDTVVDYTLYHYQTNLEDEAHYLSAVLNSSVLDQLVKPLQSKGEFGERHFVKKPLEFPIPKFNQANDIHKELADLGRKAREAACGSLYRILKELGLLSRLEERGYLTPQEMARVRETVRRELAPIIQKIDRGVKQLLRVGNRNSLLDYL